MQLIRVFMAACAILLTGMVQTAQAQDWRLVDADTISTESYLILTVPLEDPAVLADVAAQIEATYGVPLTAEWPLQAISVHCLIFDASAAPDLDALIAQMEADARIRTVQRMQGFDLTANGYSDPLFPLQWSLAQMNAVAAHGVSTGVGVKVGVVDSAIDRFHPDLASSVVDARDFVSAAPAPLAEAHGTAVAGIIAAEAANAVGMVGVAPQADVLGLRACWQAEGEPGACNSFSLARAINFALLNDVDVLNLSVGGPDDPLLAELIEAAIGQGMIIVAASGESDDLVFPASMRGVIAAGQGPGPRIPAPMVDVITTAPGERHRYVSGSSVATAHVSGVVALMLAQDRSLTADRIGEALRAAIVTREEKTSLDACAALGQIGALPAACDE